MPYKNNLTGNFFAASLLLIVWMLVVPSIAAQTITGEISGTVTDSNAAIIAGATVVVTNTNTGIRREVTVNETGSYRVSLLPPGDYQISVNAPNFRAVVKDNIKVDVEQTVKLDFELAVEGVSGVVNVTDEVQLTDPETAARGQTIDNKRVNELPLNGRNPLELSRLSTGVNLLASSFLDVRNFNLTSLSINGGQGGQNAFLVDGGSSNLPHANEYAVAPNVDAVQEFKVQTNPYSAEFGTTSGGVINVITKQGGNAFRGSLFEFVRNDALDANTWTNNRAGVRRAPLRYNQFGGTISGPIFLPAFGEGGPFFYNGRNRTFFLFNYEGFRFRTTSTVFSRVPTALERAGDFSQTFAFVTRGGVRSAELVRLFDPVTTVNNPNGAGQVRSQFASSVLPAARLSPVALNALSFIPLPNRTPDDITGTNNYVATPSSFVDQDQFTVRLDHRFSQANTIYGRYSQQDAFNTANPPIFGLDNLAEPNGSTQERDNKNLVINDTHVFTPSLFNELRLSISRQFLESAPPGLGQNLAQQIGLPASIPGFLFPRFNIDGGTAIGGRPEQLALRKMTALQVTDNVSIIRGKHSIKIGVDYRRNSRSNFQPFGASGVFDFSNALTGNPQSFQAEPGFGLASFLLGAVSGGQVNVDFERDDSYQYVGGFVQDDYKITPRLTLNLGLRYDLFTPWREKGNRVSNFNRDRVNALTGLPGVLEFAGVDFERTPLDTDRNNFGPRAGFALDVFGNASTIVRGGYGIFFYQNGYTEQLPTLGFSANTPFTTALANRSQFQLDAGPAIIAQPVGTSLGEASFLGRPVSFRETNTKTSNTQQWSFGIQQALPFNSVIDVSYVGSHNANIANFSFNVNQLDEQFFALGTGLDTQVPNPFLGRLPADVVRGTFLANATISRQQSLLPFPAFGAVNVLFPQLSSTVYHSGQARLEKRFSQGLSFLASYTFSKIIGDSGRNNIDFSTAGGAPQFNVGCGQNIFYNRRDCRSIEPQDVTHNLTVSTVYELPFGRGQRFLSNGSGAAIFGGFQINAILAARSGLPLVIRGANNRRADRPNLLRDPRLPGDEQTLDRWFDTAAFVAPPLFTLGDVPRAFANLRGPSFASLDLSLIRNIPITERARIQLRAEAFNVTNKTNFNQPDTNFLSGTFGRILTAGEPRRIQLAAKFEF